MYRTVIGSCVVFALVGCATLQLPAAKLEANEASIRSAQEVGALSVPAAKLHIEFAKDETARAKKMASEGDARAELMLGCAQADADLAMALTREQLVHSDALKAAADLAAVQAREVP